MAWKHNGRTIKIGKAWVSDDNTKYPRQWNNLTTSEKNSAGLVWEDDPTPLGAYDSFYYWGWNSDGTAQNVQSKLKNCGFSVHVVNGAITKRISFGACVPIPTTKSFGGAIAGSKSSAGFGLGRFNEIPALSDLCVISGTTATQYDCGDIKAMGGFHHSGAEDFPDEGDKVKLRKNYTYDGGVDSFVFYANPPSFQSEPAKYLALALGERTSTCVGVCFDKTIVGFIVIEIATATVVVKYNCS